MNQKLPSLSIIFPSLNDAKILPYLIAKTYGVAPKVAKIFELIVVNDGSTDDTKEVLAGLKRRYPHLRVIHHPRPSGYGGAVRAGLAKARYEWVFYTDGDGQYDVMELIKLVKAVRSGVDVVNGYKVQRGDSLVRKIIGSLYNSAVQAFYHPPIRDVDCDFRLVRRSLLNKIRLTATSGLFPLELVLKLKEAGARFTEVEVHHYPRPCGRSQFFRLSRILSTLREHPRFSQVFSPPLNT